MDAQKEVNFKGFKTILDEAKIPNNETQINQLVLILDTDKDVMLSYEELEDFLDQYDEKKPIASNLFSQIGGKKDKFK